MFRLLRQWFQRKGLRRVGLSRTRPAPRERLLARYQGRVLIVHRGFEQGWLDELFKLPGASGYFRIDVRQLAGQAQGTGDISGASLSASPLDWLIERYMLALERDLRLPLPLLVQVRDDALRVRHLTEAGRVRYPSDIAWILDEIETRYHAILLPDGEGFRVEPGIAVEDNAVETPYGFSL